jgi:N-acyl-D-amino-acid deacylase
MSRHALSYSSCLVVCLLGTPASGQVQYFDADSEVPVTGDAVDGFEHVDAYFVDLLRNCDLPGASVAIAKDGKLAYARGFGWADVEAREPVRPNTLFRIASVSKPITSVAIMRLVEQGKLRLDDRAFDLLDFQPPENGDQRIEEITIDQLLEHRGGFDRGMSGDPMFMSRRIADEMGVESPPDAETIVRWMARRPLDFDPGERSVYSNLGFAVLGLVIERVSGKDYEDDVKDDVLAPLGITRMRAGRTQIEGRADSEARYYTRASKHDSVFDDRLVEGPYGAWALEPMIAHGGWIASSVDLVRFASAIGTDDFDQVLSRESIEAMFTTDEDKGDGSAFYARGWSVRHWDDRGRNTWHAGSLPGTSTILVRRWDGMAWAVLFNTRDGLEMEGQPAGFVDGPMHRLVDAVKVWPEEDGFEHELESQPARSKH